MKRQTAAACLLAVWSLVFAHTVRATTLAEFMGAYESDLLQWAAVTALLGGGLRTIFSLQSDGRAVRDVSIEATWDAGKALVAGLLAFVLIQSLRSMDWSIPSEVRFAAVLVAGWARFAFLEWFAMWLKAKRNQAMGKDFSPTDKGQP